MKQFAKATLLAALTLLFALSSCNRNELLDTEDDTLAQRNALAEDTYDDVQSIAEQAAAGELEGFRTGEAEEIASGCATISRDSSGGVKTITIDFGTTNCLCKDGKNRRGKIIVSLTGRHTEPGTVITCTFEDFYVNDNHIEGTKTATNMGLNPKGHLLFHIVVSNGKITLANGEGEITWEADKYREFMSGYDTPRDFRDDNFRIWGTRSGTRKDGNSYTAVVREGQALVRRAGCRWFVSGIVTITPEGERARTLDFGNGECDDQATLSVGRRSRTITLRR